MSDLWRLFCLNGRLTLLSIFNAGVDPPKWKKIKQKDWVEPFVLPLRSRSRSLSAADPALTPDQQPLPTLATLPSGVFHFDDVADAFSNTSARHDLSLRYDALLSEALYSDPGLSSRSTISALCLAGAMHVHKSIHMMQ